MLTVGPRRSYCISADGRCVLTRPTRSYLPFRDLKILKQSKVIGNDAGDIIRPDNYLNPVFELSLNRILAINNFFFGFGQISNITYEEGVAKAESY